jgi:hypothetical protein
MPRTANAAIVPLMAGFHPLIVLTARTIVKASTTSTSEAVKAAPMAGAAVVKESICYLYLIPV